MAPKSTNKAAATPTTGKKASKQEAVKAEELQPEPTDRVLSAEEAEELEEQAEASASAGSESGNAAALAAVAGGSATESASFKNFRHHPDMENFYRFIFENDLRHEALGIIDQIMTEKAVRKQVKLSKSQPN
jgi:hypothetical protein